jgi:hypothetical protein
MARHVQTTEQLRLFGLRQIFLSQNGFMDLLTSAFEFLFLHLAFLVQIRDLSLETVFAEALDREVSLIVYGRGIPDRTPTQPSANGMPTPSPVAIKKRIGSSLRRWQSRGVGARKCRSEYVRFGQLLCESRTMKSP